VLEAAGCAEGVAGPSVATAKSVLMRIISTIAARRVLRDYVVVSKLLQEKTVSSIVVAAVS
jgi:hypothetical protein